MKIMLVIIFIFPSIFCHNPLSANWTGQLCWWEFFLQMNQTSLSLFMKQLLIILTKEKRRLLLTASTQPNVIFSVYMEVLGLHKGSLCSPERSQAAWDHTEGGSCSCHRPVPVRHSLGRWKTATFESTVHTPTPNLMTQQLIDNRDIIALWLFYKREHLQAFIILFWFVMNERGSRRLILSCFFPEASVFI